MKKFNNIEVYLYISPLKTKKYRAIFYNIATGDKIHHTDFGSKNHSDYTIHGDNKRKNSYLKRHEKREDWNDPYSPGALSRYVLWNKTTLASSWEYYKKKFNFANSKSQ